MSERAKAYRELAEAHAIEREAMQRMLQMQNQLVQQEKMASLGRLTAGIAHEIKNPLNFVNNFAALSTELAGELEAELAEGRDLSSLQPLLSDLKTNAIRIEDHGKRADAIVRGMMAHARGGGGEPQRVDLNALVEEHVGLAYHGKRAHTPGFTVELVQDYDPAVGEAEVSPQELGRVILNLCGNAFDAVAQQTEALNGQAANEAYTPTVRISTQRQAEGLEIRVADNGPGISELMRGHIFEPFFTTKPTGVGTGLGLSLSHDIVTQQHKGTLRVETEEGAGATFIIGLPA